MCDLYIWSLLGELDMYTRAPFWDLSKFPCVPHFYLLFRPQMAFMAVHALPLWFLMSAIRWIRNLLVLTESSFDLVIFCSSLFFMASGMLKLMALPCP